MTRGEPPAIVKIVRMRYFILGVACVFACGKGADGLRSRSAPLVVVDADGAFGTQAVTTTSVARSFVVRPAPPADSLQFDRIEAIESTCPEFLIDAPDAAGAVVQRFCTGFVGGEQYGGGGETMCVGFEELTYSFKVRFAPTQQVASSDQCRIIVRLDGGSSKQIPVSGTGIAPPLSATIAPRTPIDFFTVNLGVESAPRTFQVKNTGSGPLTVSASTVLATGVFTVTGDTTSHQLAPNASTIYEVTCTPTSAALFNGSITVTTNDPDAADSSVTIPFVCQGIDHPIGNTDGPRTQVVVGNSNTVTVALTNLSATDTVTGLSVALSQPVPGLTIQVPPAGSLLPLANTTVQLLWQPTEPYQGPLGGLTLSVDGEPDRLIGIAMAQATIADVKSSIPTTEKLEFGRLCIGESKKLSFTMQPGGDDSDVFANYVVKTVSGTAPFTAALNGGSVVQVGSPPTLATIDVTVMPMISDGTFDGTITVGTDSPTEPSFDVAAIVQVLQGGTTVNPPLINFREVIVTGFSDTKTTTFTNCTADTIEITGVALDGESATDFDIIQIMPDGVDRLPPFSLPRGGEVVIAVQMLPQSDGTKEAQIGIDFQEPGKPATSVETVALLGEGFLRTPDRDSYYACSTGSPLHSAPLGLVVGFLVVRRRRRRR